LTKQTLYFRAHPTHGFLCFGRDCIAERLVYNGFATAFIQWPFVAACPRRANSVVWPRGVLVSGKIRPTGKSSSAAESSPSELSLHLLRAQEEERKRISRELHDETGQGLMVLRLFLSGLTEEVGDEELQAKVAEAISMLDRTISDLRRIIARLSPRALEELGLMGAIRKEARELARSSGIRAKLALQHELRDVDHEAEIALYRAVQESLTNISRHSQARNFSLSLEPAGGRIRLQIEDDGVGLQSRATTGRFGLFGMRERIAALGGAVRIRSKPGQGTRINITLPLHREKNTHVQGRRRGVSRARRLAPARVA
jgi:signal transduction histidine kinase